MPFWGGEQRRQRTLDSAWRYVRGVGLRQPHWNIFRYYECSYIKFLSEKNTVTEHAGNHEASKEIKQSWKLYERIVVSFDGPRIFFLVLSLSWCLMVIPCFWFHSPGLKVLLCSASPFALSSHSQTTARGKERTKVSIGKLNRCWVAHANNGCHPDCVTKRRCRGEGLWYAELEVSKLGKFKPEFGTRLESLSLPKSC